MTTKTKERRFFLLLLWYNLSPGIPCKVSRDYDDCEGTSSRSDNTNIMKIRHHRSRRRRYRCRIRAVRQDNRFRRQYSLWLKRRLRRWLASWLRSRSSERLSSWLRGWLTSWLASWCWWWLHGRLKSRLCSGLHRRYRGRLGWSIKGVKFAGITSRSWSTNEDIFSSISIRITPQTNHSTSWQSFSSFPSDYYTAVWT